MKFENEELEIKVEAAEKVKASLDDAIEEAYAESRDLRKNIDKISAEKCLIKRKADDAIRYKEYAIMTLEATIENKNDEIEILKAKSKFKVDDINEIDSDSDSQKLPLHPKVWVVTPVPLQF